MGWSQDASLQPSFHYTVDERAWVVFEYSVFPQLVAAYILDASHTEEFLDIPSECLHVVLLEALPLQFLVLCEGLMCLVRERNTRAGLLKLFAFEGTEFLAVGEFIHTYLNKVSQGIFKVLLSTPSPCLHPLQLGDRH